ncbi:MAG: hypothetical protein JJU31_16365 [Wenzhouxiangella sp.]|nr:hypothetical protein [Wenzhouxiangella sp.]
MAIKWMLLFAWLSLVTTTASAAELSIDSGSGRAGALSWGAFQVDWRPKQGWQFRISDLMLDGEQGLGDWRLDCQAGPVSGSLACEDGRLAWILDDQTMLEARVDVASDADHWQARLSGSGWQLEARLPMATPAELSAELVLDDFPLEALPARILEWAGLSMLAGKLSGSVEVAPRQPARAALLISELALDTVDGAVAADGVVLALDLQLELDEDTQSVTLALEQRAGEILAGPVYLPAPEQHLQLSLQARRLGPDIISLQDIRLLDGTAMRAAGQAELLLDEEVWVLNSLALDQVLLQLPGFWQRWAEGFAAQVGFGDIDSAGRIEATVAWSRSDGIQARAWLDAIELQDPAERLALSRLDGEMRWGQRGLDSELSWQTLLVHGLPFGASILRLAADAGGTRLAEPLQMPLLDGAVVIEQFSWQPADAGNEGDSGGLRMDARIKPLSLARLTKVLGWPEFGGVLSGEFPGIVYVDEQLRFTGGIAVQAFSGTVLLDDLVIERPFGTLPALSAQVEITRLDLLELTGAFNFGRMEGEISGWMRDLRLLDWRPVAMDARFYTHEDARRRRISQRAVDNLSSLGGAGGALITGTVLRVFDDFPYRRAGLACRLANNICHIDGVARHESGGFYIVEGRSLPRLDIIGHRRLVDWPQLISQLESMLD